MVLAGVDFRSTTMAFGLGKPSLGQKNSNNIYFYLFSILNYKTKPNRKENGQLLFR